MKSQTAPEQFAYDDDGNVIESGVEAIFRLTAEIDQMQANNRRVLGRMKFHELARFETWLRTSTSTQPPARPKSPQVWLPTGRAPREARNDRHRGSRRGERATSSSSDDPDPEPPGPRTCGCGCGAGIHHLAPQARYLNAAHRKRAQRARDRRDPDRVAERHVSQRTIGDLARKCRCRLDGAVYFDRQLGTVCLHCGRRRSWIVPVWVNGHADWRPDQEVLEVLAEQASLGASHTAISREWKTRPRRGSDLAAKSRRINAELKREWGVVA